MVIPGGKQREKKEIFEAIIVRHQTTDPGSSENTKWTNADETTQGQIIFELPKIIYKEKNLEESQRKKTPP